MSKINFTIYYRHPHASFSHSENSSKMKGFPVEKPGIFHLELDNGSWMSTRWLALKWYWCSRSKWSILFCWENPWTTRCWWLLPSNCSVYHLFVWIKTSTHANMFELNSTKFITTYFNVILHVKILHYVTVNWFLVTGFLLQKQFKHIGSNIHVCIRSTSTKYTNYYLLHFIGH